VDIVYIVNMNMVINKKDMCQKIKVKRLNLTKKQEELAEKRAEEDLKRIVWGRDNKKTKKTKKTKKGR